MPDTFDCLKAALADRYAVRPELRWTGRPSRSGKIQPLVRLVGSVSCPT